MRNINSYTMNMNRLSAMGAALSGVVALTGAAVLAYGHLQTDAEANMAHTALKTEVDLFAADINKQFAQDRIDRAKREISKIDYELLYGNLSVPEKEFKRSRRAELVALVACIQAGNQNC